MGPAGRAYRFVYHRILLAEDIRSARHETTEDVKRQERARYQSIKSATIDFAGNRKEAGRKHRTTGETGTNKNEDIAIEEKGGTSDIQSNWTWSPKSNFAKGESTPGWGWSSNITNWAEKETRGKWEETCPVEKVAGRGNWAQEDRDVERISETREGGRAASPGNRKSKVENNAKWWIWWKKWRLWWPVWAIWWRKANKQAAAEGYTQQREVREFSKETIQKSWPVSQRRLSIISALWKGQKRRWSRLSVFQAREKRCEGEKGKEG